MPVRDRRLRPAARQQEALNITFTPSSDEQRSMMLSEAFISVAYSPRGEGKTTGGLFTVVYHTMQFPEIEWPMRWALVRDTRRALGRTTARTIMEWFPQPHTHWRGDPDEPEAITVFIENVPAIIFDCFGVNSPDDLSRFQSYEASGGVWIEEPAPAATNSEFSSQGISESVLAMAITSLRGSKRPRVLVTMNPPAATHWTAQLWHLPGWDEAGDTESELSEEQQEAREELRAMSQVFFMPPGSNKALDIKTPGYREKNRIALLAAGRSDLVARLVEGRLGFAQLGEAVTPLFSVNHTTPETPIIPRGIAYIGLDFGLQPAAVIAQIAPSGHLLIHAALGLENAGIEQLVEKRLRPWLNAHPEIQRWVFIGGTEGVQAEQTNSELNAVKSLIGPHPVYGKQGLLGGRYLRGPIPWSERRDACHEALTKHIGGVPWLRINQKGASQLIHALGGAWHYPADISGRPRTDLPEKRGLPPSFGDAFAHLCAVLLHRSARTSPSSDRRALIKRPSASDIQRFAHSRTRA